MASVFGVGAGADRGSALGVVACRRGARASNIDVSEPGGDVYIRPLAGPVSLEEVIMTTPGNKARVWIGRILSVAIVIGAIVLGVAVIDHTARYPRTDDSAIFANLIGIAPQVEGPLVRLSVHDNEFVKKGDVLFEIDDRPYRYALEKAISDQAALEGQISDERRRIAAQVSAVSVSEANIHSTEADVSRWAAAVQGGCRCGRTSGQPREEWMYASNNLH